MTPVHLHLQRRLEYRHPSRQDTAAGAIGRMPSLRRNPRHVTFLLGLTLKRFLMPAVAVRVLALWHPLPRGHLRLPRQVVSTSSHAEYFDPPQDSITMPVVLALCLLRRLPLRFHLGKQYHLNPLQHQISGLPLRLLRHPFQHGLGTTTEYIHPFQTQLLRPCISCRGKSLLPSADKMQQPSNRRPLRHLLALHHLRAAEYIHPPPLGPRCS